MTASARLAVTIERFVDDHFPGFVECAIELADGSQRRFVEKIPVVSLENLTWQSSYPRPTEIACDVVARFKDALGRDLLTVSVAPSGIEMPDTETRLIVLADKVKQP